MKKNITETLESSVLVMIGSKEQIIKKYSLKERDYKGERFAKLDHTLLGFDDILSLTKPQVISEIDERFLKSGADIIVTNTSKANRFHLKEFGLEDITYELNLASAKIARDKVSKYSSITRNKPRYAAGCVSSLPNDLDLDFVQSIYSEQIKALLAGRVDLIIFHKMQNEQSIIAAFDSLNSILAKRDKSMEVILSIENPDLMSWLTDIEKVKPYENINLIAVGTSTFDIDVYSDLKENSQYKLFVFMDDLKEYDEIICIENSEKIFEQKLVDIIAYDAVFQPSAVEKIIDILSK
ncbi:MAG: homocysteine S-methyltransferase family protein [Bacteroidales bacterium]|nr:homocysteine S-methyltransferase family protein [Bacteroidales bacterium]